MKMNTRIFSVMCFTLCAAVLFFHGSAGAAVSVEEIYIDRGTVEYVNYMDGFIQMGDRNYYFRERDKNQLGIQNISRSDPVEIYYKKVDDKNMITRINRIQKK